MFPKGDEVCDAAKHPDIWGGCDDVSDGVDHLGWSVGEGWICFNILVEIVLLFSLEFVVVYRSIDGASKITEFVLVVD
jgi:hypothetical protein